MSEPRRWWVLAEHHQTPLLSESKPDAPEECLFRVIEAEPVEKRIKDLEAQLAEANAVAEFYADEKNWMTTRKDELHEARMTIIQDPESFGVYSEPGLASTLLLIGGKRARQYLQKWEVGK